MPVIEVDGLTKRYGDTVAVDGVSFSVEEGEIFGIVGPNGAGKTTTVECVEGLRAADSGHISVLGLHPRRDRRKVRQVLGAQLQESNLPDALRVGEALRLYRSFYRDGADPERLMRDLGLDEKRGTAFSDLSGGQRQRLSIALALVGNPRVAVLDELTTGLDPHARRDTWGLIDQVRDSGVTVLLVTHFMEEAERLCDRVAIIDRARLVALDTPAGLVARVDAEQRLSFRPSRRFDPAVLTELAEVSAADSADGKVVVTGQGNLLGAVTGALNRHDVAPLDLRVEQASLDDAFLALTGRTLDDDLEEAAR